jgi:Zn-dependent M28 family amino/carboxypeptidase
VRFALWGAEEAGLLGSEHYVRQLSRTDRDAIALYLNFDMIASPNGGPFVHDGTGIDPVSAAVTHDVTAFLRDRGDGPELTPFDGRSDYAPFLAAGIPAGGLHTGAEGILTEEQAARWGGTAGAPHDPCYHQACDTLDNIGRDLLATGADVVAHTVGRYAEHLPHTSP